MNDVERALELLIHDVRTPLGVAQGYVRLLQEHRLEAADDRERALIRTMDALGRISRLCADASAFIGHEGHETAGASAVIAATVLAASVDTRARRSRIAIGRVAIEPRARIRVSGDPEGLADAIGVVIATVARSASDGMPTLAMETCRSELRFVAAPRDLPPGAPAAGSPQPFDPWHGRDLAVPVACRTIDRAAGRVSIVESAVVVTLPLEVLAA